MNLLSFLGFLEIDFLFFVRNTVVGANLTFFFWRAACFLVVPLSPSTMTCGIVAGKHGLCSALNFVSCFRFLDFCLVLRPLRNVNSPREAVRSQSRIGSMQSKFFSFDLISLSLQQCFRDHGGMPGTSSEGYAMVRLFVKVMCSFVHTAVGKR